MNHWEPVRGCDFCGKKTEQYAPTDDELPGKVFCSTKCCDLYAAAIFCAKCGTGKIRNDADTCDVCPKCEPEDQATHRARSRDAATREDADEGPSGPGSRAPFTEPDFSLGSDAHCVCMACGVVAFWPDVHNWHDPWAVSPNGVASTPICTDRCSNGQSKYNIGAWVEAGLRKLCETRYTEFLTIGPQNEDTIIVGDLHGVWSEQPRPGAEWTTTLRAGHPDNRESSGKDEDGAVNDWFDRYGQPPPKELRDVLSPRWQMVCDIALDGYSRTEGVNRTKRIGNACSAHFLSWAFVATGCKTDGDRG